MKAIIKTQNQNGHNYSGEKELVSAYSILGKINGEMCEVVTARAYMGRSRNANTVYASLWVHAGDIHCAGHGQAGGYGYHKESAAFQDAINSAGIELIGSPYADDNGMHYVEVPNPEFDPVELARLEALDTPEGIEEYKRYKWRVPAHVRKLVKDTGKKPCHIGGCGSSSMRSAFLAIARAAGAKGKLIFVSH